MRPALISASFPIPSSVFAILGKDETRIKEVSGRKILEGKVLNRFGPPRSASSIEIEKMTQESMGCATSFAMQCFVFV